MIHDPVSLGIHRQCDLISVIAYPLEWDRPSSSRFAIVGTCLGPMMILT